MYKGFLLVQDELAKKDEVVRVTRFGSRDVLENFKKWLEDKGEKIMQKDLKNYESLMSILILSLS